MEGIKKNLKMEAGSSSRYWQVSARLHFYHIPVTVMFALEVSDHGSKYTVIGFKMKPV
jgi:hypothetical protein